MPQKQKRAAPWFVLAGICAVAVAAIAALGISVTASSDSVVPNPRGQPSVVEMTSTSDEGRMQVASIDWTYWQEVNPDIVAWILVPGTAIDYAVVQAPDSDPTFYLSHDIYRNWNPYGCPYVDAGCDGVTGVSTVVFGHNMGRSGAMFTDFARFSDEVFAQVHRTAFLSTPTETIELSVSAIDVVDGRSPLKRTDLTTHDELVAWYEERYEGCRVKLGNDATATQVFTFVTCSYSTYANERTLVYAQVKQERP